VKEKARRDRDPRRWRSLEDHHPSRPGDAPTARLLHPVQGYAHALHHRQQDLAQVRALAPVLIGAVPLDELEGGIHTIAFSHYLVARIRRIAAPGRAEVREVPQRKGPRPPAPG